MARHHSSGVGAHAQAERVDCGLDCRRFEVAGVPLELRQDLRGSGALRPLDDERAWTAGRGDEEAAPPPMLKGEELHRVGLAAWQAGFLLGDLLLRRPPFGAWHGIRVLDLGCGTGLVGILLALAGAEVVLSDRPHILPLAEQNAEANLTPGLHRANLVAYSWGQGDAAATLLPALASWQGPPPIPATAVATLPSCVPAAAAGPNACTPPALLPAVRGTPPAGAAASPRPAGSSSAHVAAATLPCFDVVTAADVVYQPEYYAELAATLRAVAAPHTLVFVAFKQRGLQEDSFLALLEGTGFALQEVPQGQMAPEYQTGSYRVVRACRIE